MATLHHHTGGESNVTFFFVNKLFLPSKTNTEHRTPSPHSAQTRTPARYHKGRSPNQMPSSGDFGVPRIEALEASQRYEETAVNNGPYLFFPTGRAGMAYWQISRTSTAHGWNPRDASALGKESYRQLLVINVMIFLEQMHRNSQ